LVIVEFAHGAHIDSLLAFLVILALYLLYTNRKAGSAVALGLATLTKFIPLLLVPVFLRQWGWRRSLLYLAVIVLGLLPFLGAGLGLVGELDGRGILGAVRIYNAVWKTNDGLLHWFARALEPFSMEPVALARLISVVLLGLSGLWVFNFVAGKESGSGPEGAIQLSALLISAYLLLSAVVFPWYLTTLMALLPLFQVGKSRPTLLFIIGWLYFSAAVNLSYLTYLDPANPRELEWVRSVEYVPLWIAMFAAILLILRDQVMPDRDLHPTSGRD
jgi:hypothetical protein